MLYAGASVGGTVRGLPVKAIRRGTAAGGTQAVKAAYEGERRLFPPVGTVVKLGTKDGVVRCAYSTDAFADVTGPTTAIKTTDGSDARDDVAYAVAITPSGHVFAAIETETTHVFLQGCLYRATAFGGFSIVGSWDSYDLGPIVKIAVSDIGAVAALSNYFFSGLQQVWAKIRFLASPTSSAFTTVTLNGNNASIFDARFCRGSNRLFYVSRDGTTSAWTYYAVRIDADGTGKTTVLTRGGSAADRPAALAPATYGGTSGMAILLANGSVQFHGPDSTGAALRTWTGAAPAGADRMVEYGRYVISFARGSRALRALDLTTGATHDLTAGDNAIDAASGDGYLYVLCEGSQIYRVYECGDGSVAMAKAGKIDADCDPVAIAFTEKENK